MFNVRLLFSPHFVIKFYLARDIQQLVSTYSFKGTVLDVGCGTKPYKEFFRHTRTYIGIDFKDYSSNNEFISTPPDYYFDSTYRHSSRLPFKSGSYSHCVAFQVLEHHTNPQKLIKEMIRVIKPRGYILLSVPFVGGLHEEPHDYFRITEFSINSICRSEKVQLIDVKKQGSVFSTIATLLMDALMEIASKNIFLYIISVAIYPLVYGYGLFSLILDRVIKTNKVFLNYTFVIKK